MLKCKFGLNSIWQACTWQAAVEQDDENDEQDDETDDQTNETDEQDDDGFLTVAELRRIMTQLGERMPTRSN